MSSIKQHSINKAISISGVGLHTGSECTLTFQPAPEHHGFKFQRLDLPNQPIMNADVDYVVDTSRGTTLEHNGCRVNTVEHVLAALAGHKSITTTQKYVTVNDDVKRKCVELV